MEFSDQEIIEFMIANIPEDAIFHKNPERYIQRRKETEKWLYQTFRALGGIPMMTHPIYMTLGISSYIESIGHYTARQEFPLSLFPESAISFTYPDSYVSRILAENSNEYFNPKVHGKVFMVSELNHLLEDPSIHNEAWKNEKRKFDFFIEAQIWDIEPILKVKSNSDFVHLAVTET
jgi:hypothetical protein